MFASPAISHFLFSIARHVAAHGLPSDTHLQTRNLTHIDMQPIFVIKAILAEGAIALPVTLSGGALFAS